MKADRADFLGKLALQDEVISGYADQFAFTKIKLEADITQGFQKFSNRIDASSDKVDEVRQILDNLKIS